MPEFYIKATGSTCYNREGVSFPIVEPVDWEALLGGLESPAPRWEQQFGWNNQPEVLVFSASEEEAELVDQRVDAHPSLHFMALVRTKDW